MQEAEVMIRQRDPAPRAHSGVPPEDMVEIVLAKSWGKHPKGAKIRVDRQRQERLRADGYLKAGGPGTPLSSVPGIGPAIESALAGAGIENAEAAAQAVGDVEDAAGAKAAAAIRRWAEPRGAVSPEALSSGPAVALKAGGDQDV